MKGADWILWLVVMLPWCLMGLAAFVLGVVKVIVK